MVAVLVRLRLTLRGRPHADRTLLALYWAAGAVLGVGAAGLSALAVSFAVEGRASLAGVLLQGLLFGILVGWVIMPLSVPQLQDAMADPVRLEMYPLSVRQQVMGLGLGALLAPTALLALLAACGPAFAAGMPWWGRLLALIDAVVFAALCVAVSRAIQSAMSGAMQSRRGRDVSVVLAAVGSLAMYGSFQALPYVIPADGSAPTVSPLIGEIVAWSPTGAVGQAALASRVGAAPAALGWSALAVLWLALVLAAWGWVISRSAIRSRSRSDRSSRRARAGLSLPPLVAMRVRDPRVLAAVSQHLRYLRRHPRLLQSGLLGIGLGAFVSHGFTGSDWLGAGAAFAAAYLTIMLGAGLFNLDGEGIGFLAVTGAELRKVLIGKQAVVLGVAIAFGLVFAIAEAAWSDQWRNLPAAILFVIAMALWSMAGGVISSTRFAADGEKSSRSGASIGAVFGLLGWILAGMGVVALLYGLVGIWWPRWIGGAAMVAIALVLHRVSLRANGAALERAPELITAKIPAPA